MSKAPPRALLIDLNNFARYPTLSVGLLAAVLRRASWHVSVFAPLMVGVKGVVREAPPQRFSLRLAQINHHIATSRWTWLRQWRDRWAARRLSEVTQHQAALLQAVRQRVASERPDVLLISSYLMYHDLCAQLTAWARSEGLPVVLGGPYLVQAEVMAAWSALPGLTALVAGEVELRLPAILDSVLAGDDLGVHEGVVWRDAHGVQHGRAARPLLALDAVPVPDYSDFPWSAYPNRLLSVITGRGCGWGACSFCSDVSSGAGRTFRSRSLGHVLVELAAHHREHAVSHFVFTDMKLNSDLTVWRGLLAELPSVVPKARWIASVHVGQEADNGLSAADLQAAAAAGCVRLTTGLETGSQALAERMKKGTQLAQLSTFFHNATQAGISVRTTMIIGHPGETADDVEASADFLAQHSHVIERVSLNRLSLVMGTVLHRELQRKPGSFQGVAIVREDARLAQAEHHNAVMQSAPHRRAVMRLLSEVHRINRRPLLPQAREFEGVM